MKKTITERIRSDFRTHGGLLAVLVFFVACASCEVPFNADIYDAASTKQYFRVEGLKINPGTVNLATGDSVQLTVSFRPARASNREISWISGDPSLVTVSASGRATAVASTGSAVITATSLDSGLIATCTVNIVNPVTYTITYIDNVSGSGTVPVDGNSYTAGQTPTVQGNSGALSYSTNVFEGWNTESDGSGTFYAPGDLFTINSDVTLYSMWILIDASGNLSSIQGNPTSVIIPAGVTSISSSAFASANALQTVSIPASVTSIGVEAFMNCSSLVSFTVDSGNTSFEAISGALYDTAGTLLQVPARTSGVFAISAGTANISLYAFSNCGNLSGITIPASMTTIGGNAFSGMSSQIQLIIPSTVTSIGAFAFTYSSFTKITVPSPVITIGASAFFNCDFLLDIVMQRSSPPALQDALAFGGTTPGTLQIHVPDAASQTAYQGAMNWTPYAAQIVTP